MKTELISYLFLFYLTLLVSGIPQFTTCPSSVCLSQPVTYECNSGSDSLTWIVLDTNGDRVGTPVPYNQFNSVGDTGSIDGQFNTVLINNTNPFGANITFTPTLSMNNYTVQCGGPFGTILVNCSIVIADIPFVTITANASFGPPPYDYITLGFDIQDPYSCITQYIVMREDEIQRVNFTFADANDVKLPLPSVNNTIYNFRIMTVDTGGRYSLSNLISYIFNVPIVVADLMLTQTDYPTDINDTVNITVSWKPPRLTPRPIQLGFYIYYNVSDVPQTVEIIYASYVRRTISRNLSGFILGSVYTVGVAAYNALGTGSTTSATITILATPPPPEISSTSTVDFTSSFTSGISATPTMTPSSSMTPSNAPTNQASPLSGGAIAGIVVAIIVLGVLIILVIAIVCYVKKKNQDKPAPSVAPQMIDATNYAQVDHSVKSSSSKRQAPPEPAKSTSQEPVVYSAIQKFEASHNSPPQEGTEYADLDHSASASARYNQRPKDTSHQVQYSDVSHNSRR